jgi:hypothetical protein
LHQGADTVQPRGVKNWLGRLPAALTPDEIRLIAAAAAKPDTWRA